MKLGSFTVEVMRGKKRLDDLIHNTDDHQIDIDNVKISSAKDTMTMKHLFDQMD